MLHSVDANQMLRHVESKIYWSWMVTVTTADFFIFFFASLIGVNPPRKYKLVPLVVRYHSQHFPRTGQCGLVQDFTFTGDINHPHLIRSHSSHQDNYISNSVEVVYYLQDEIIVMDTSGKEKTLYYCLIIAKYYPYFSL